MSPAPPLPSRQSRLTDDFLYFFLRLRKDRMRKVVADINQRYPEEALEQRARRLIDAQTQLSLLGGLILDLPTMIPVIGHAMKDSGFCGGDFRSGAHAPLPHPGDRPAVRQGYRR